MKPIDERDVTVPEPLPSAGHRQRIRNQVRSDRRKPLPQSRNGLFERQPFVPDSEESIIGIALIFGWRRILLAARTPQQ